MKKQIEGQLNLFDYVSENEDSILNKNDYNLDKNDMDYVSLYKECTNCWCSNCRHNEKLNAVPRDFAGTSKPCPACSFCIKMKHAEICEIGSYENGCKLRAIEEGLYHEEEII